MGTPAVRFSRRTINLHGRVCHGDLIRCFLRVAMRAGLITHHLGCAKDVRGAANELRRLFPATLLIMDENTDDKPEAAGGGEEETEHRQPWIPKDLEAR